MIKDVVQEIFPSDLKPLQRYRIITAIAMTILLFNAAWSRGLIPKLSAFAYADDVEKRVDVLESKVDTILVLSLQERMRELTLQQCAASPETARILDREINVLQHEHFELTKAYYTLLRRCG